MNFQIKNGVLERYTGNGGDAVIPDGVTTIGDYAFSWRSSLTSITIPSGVTTIGDNAFWNCSSLASITLPDSVTTIGNWAFSGCSSLASITLPDSVTTIGNWAFSGCSSLTSITIPPGVTAIGESAFSGCKGLADQNGFIIVRGVLFDYCGNGGDVVIPDSVTTIGDLAFCDCESLTSITIPDGVTAIGGSAFWGCSSLTSITIPDSVTSIGDRAFCDCRSLKSITIPDSVTAIGDEAFRGCSGLADQNGFITVRGVLYDYCGKGGDAVIPAGVTAIGNSAFRGCSSLTSITIPDSVTTIGNAAFLGCSGLADANGFIIVRDVLYGYCGKGGNVVIPDSVTTIGDWAFSRCSSLSSIALPSCFAKELIYFLGETKVSAIHIPTISGVSAKYRPACAVGFAEDNRSLEDEDGKGYAKYIKANAVKLIGTALEHPALFYLMVRGKLITAKDLEAVTDAVQKNGNAEFIAAILEYGRSAVSEKDKAKVTKKKEEREENVTNFIFDAEKLQALSGKKFVVTGKLKTFVSHDEFRECLENGGAILTETLDKSVDYLITNTPNSGTAKNKTAVALNIPRITEEEFNQMIGRTIE